MDEFETKVLKILREIKTKGGKGKEVLRIVQFKKGSFTFPAVLERVEIFTDVLGNETPSKRKGLQSADLTCILAQREEVLAAMNPEYAHYTKKEAKEKDTADKMAFWRGERDKQETEQKKEETISND